jgi:hypothetical protein
MACGSCFISWGIPRSNDVPWVCALPICDPLAHRSRAGRFPVELTRIPDRPGKNHALAIGLHNGPYVRSAGITHALPCSARSRTPDALGLAFDGNDGHGAWWNAL